MALVLAALVAASGVSPTHAAELFVADQTGNRIVVLDALSGAYKRTLWSTPAQVQPSAIAFGPGGDLFVANRLSGEVLRIAAADLDGSAVAGAPFATGIDYPGSLAYHGATNSMLVGEFGVYPEGPLGDEIFVYNAAGARQATLTLPPVAVAGLALDAAGNLFASGFVTDEFGSGRIYKFAGPNWSTPTPLAPDPYPMANFQGAAGLAFDPQGNLYAAGLITFNAGNVVKFSLADVAVTAQQQLGDFLPFPSGITMLPEGRLLVASLGFGPTSGNLYRVNIETGARSNVLAGDFNSDGNVDAADLVRWRQGFGLDDRADADLDGDTDGSDFTVWQRSVGNQGPPGLYSPAAVALRPETAAVGVPEPAFGLLAAAAAVGLRAAGRRWGSRSAARGGKVSPRADR
ncbi:MAG TPA: hypothetical protein VEQ85_13850 [Lacipirellulaceae bacterium]|nr:hypothetical protein [Lacipirellulaceae bacterium]